MPSRVSELPMSLQGLLHLLPHRRGGFCASLVYPFRVRVLSVLSEDVLLGPTDMRPNFQNSPNLGISLPSDTCYSRSSPLRQKVPILWIECTPPELGFFAASTITTWSSLATLERQSSLFDQNRSPRGMFTTRSHFPAGFKFLSRVRCRPSPESP